MPQPSPSPPPVVILGAGINGCALARELALNGVGVWIVDRNDAGFGATSASSRLIHGGLRYLEYGDFHLVRESLAERALLRRVAPQFVEPLRLHIPVARRGGGILRSTLRFLGSGRSPFLARLSNLLTRDAPRGLWLVRLGLRFYDWFAASDEFPRHGVRRVTAADAPRVDPERFRWLCDYSDAQMRFPERFIQALLSDARQLAAERGREFRVFTHHQAVVAGGQVELRAVHTGELSEAVAAPLIVNATGAWGDLTLERLHAPSPRLFGPTKGSHFISHNPRFREALGEGGVYAEADDGRLVFVLPFGESVLVGTTDERFEGDPGDAVATNDELRYLLGLVNDLFPEVHLTPGDVGLHYSGVRPLPYAPRGSVSAVSRDHAVVANQAETIPVLTLVGGKLTTARAFAALVADDVLRRLGLPRAASSAERPVPGGENYPATRAARDAEIARLSRELGYTEAQVRAVWQLVGNRAGIILAAERGDDGSRNLAGTNLPLAFARWVVANEWVVSLSDLVERRLMLLFEPGLTEATVRDAAACLSEAGLLPAEKVDAAVAETIERLQREHGCRFAG